MYLRDYLHKFRICKADFARQVKYCREHISGVAEGRIRGGIRFAEAVEKETKGLVTAQEVLEAYDQNKREMEENEKFLSKL